ncbi:hypothetical protein LC653_26295 [Nostoc sp. CHAB 5784]|nr:hypothetical protein [Nostoc mirabile]MCC5667300.1 hypothetical protein [Nostoc mirabile CHAB5784]
MQQDKSALVKQIEDFKTDSFSLDKILQKSDFDKQLEQDFNTIDGDFCRL